MPDARLRLKELYSGRADPHEWRYAQGDLLHGDLLHGDKLDAARAASQGVDAFSSAALKNSTCSLSDVRRWKQQFPALRERNFFVIQNHFATAKHYDLRLQLDGAMFSWAIPRGFDEPHGGVRRAIETFPHGMSYAVYEGLATFGKSHNGIWDVGSYEVDDYRQRGDLTNEETPPRSWDDDAVPSDVTQETRLREALQFCHFERDEPGQTGLDGKRSFILVLKGHRFKNLKLKFQRGVLDVTHLRPKDFRMPTENKQWTVAICHPREHIAEAAKQANTSVLTGRTMVDINKESRAALEADPMLVVQQERAWADEVATMSQHGGAENLAVETASLTRDLASQMVKEEEPD